MVRKCPLSTWVGLSHSLHVLSTLTMSPCSWPWRSPCNLCLYIALCLLIHTECPEWFLFLGQIYHLPSENSWSHLKRFTCSLFSTDVITSHPQAPASYHSRKPGYLGMDLKIQTLFFFKSVPAKGWVAGFLSVQYKKNNILFLSWDFGSYTINSNANLMAF